MSANLNNMVPVVGMYPNSASLYVCSPKSGGTNHYADYYKLINYIVPLIEGETYTIYFKEVGNRIRIYTTSFNPLLQLPGTYSSKLIAQPDNFSVGYNISFTAESDDKFLVIYASNLNEVPKVMVSTNGSLDYEEPDITYITSIEAEDGIVASPAVIDNRETVSGNIVVDGIRASNSGSLSMNFNVSESGIYIIKVYFTQSGDRDTCIYQGNMYHWENFNGTSYYEIFNKDIVLYLQAGDNQVVFKGGTTTYAPMFDKFEIYVLSTETENVKYLIKDKLNKYYTVIDNELSELYLESLTAEVFKEHGTDTIPSSDILLSLVNPTVYYWSSNEQSEPKLKAEITAIPHNQVIYAEDVHMTDSSILGIESVEIDADDNTLFAVSFDSGNTWLNYVNNIWVTLSEEQSGMTKMAFEDIGTDTWAEKVAQGGYYMFRFMLMDNGYVNSIVVHYLN